jgi:hypothetical protein
MGLVSVWHHGTSRTNEMTRRTRSRSCLRLATAVAACLFASPTWGQSPNRSPPSSVVGTIDGISWDGDQAFLAGWVCEQGRSQSVDLHIYAGHSAYDQPRGTLVATGRANFDNEPAVDRACAHPGSGKHRFLVAVPNEAARAAEAGKLYVHGLRLADGVEGAAIAGSAKPLRHLGTPAMPFATAAPPPLPGAYHALATHPRVFTNAAELKELASQINRQGSYSARRFARLVGQVKDDLATKIDWDATYSGCDIDIYLRAFSVEVRSGYLTEVRGEEQLRAAMKVRPGASAPTGAAIVASRLALYAALAKTGVTLPPGAPAGAAAAALAKRILLAWGEHGFRDAQQRFLPLSAFRCANQKSAHPTLKDDDVGTDIALQIGRAVVYSADAQDLLESVGALDATEASTLDTFHAAMFDLIRRSANKALGNQHPACERFANGQAAALAGLLAVARLLDDAHRVDTVLRGGDGAALVLLPWTRFVEGTIYGDADHPVECYPNSGPDGLHSGGAFTTPVVAPGEIQDRYRAGVLQTFGYPLGNLQWLFDAAEILRIAGFDPYAYRGAHHQSLEMAVQYYTCFAKTPGFYKTVSRDNARVCANFEQYYGKIVNAVEANLLIGAERFPGNATITAMEGAAREAAASSASALDAPFFGKWRD